MAITSSRLAVLLEEDTKTAGETQIQRYERLGATAPILDIIRRGGGSSMGTLCERVFRAEWPSLLKRESTKATGKKNTGYDHRVHCHVSDEFKLLEQKSSGLWSEDENDFHWQHLEIAHPWNGLLLVGIGVDRMLAWGMSRKDFETCVDRGLATNQGNKAKDSSEGMWMTYKNIKAFLTPLVTESDLQAFASTL